MGGKYSAGFIPIIFLILFLISITVGASVVYTNIVSSRINEQTQKAAIDLDNSKIEAPTVAPSSVPTIATRHSQAARSTTTSPNPTATSTPGPTAAQGGGTGPTNTPGPAAAVMVRSITFNNQTLDISGSQSISFALPGQANVSQAFDVPVIVSYSNDTTKNFIIKFNYQTAPTPTALPSDTPTPTSVQPTDTPVPTSTPAPISCNSVPGWTNTNGFWCKVSASVSSPIYVDCPSAGDSVSSVLKECMYANECIIASGVNYYTQAQGGHGLSTDIGTNFCSNDIVKNRVKVYLHAP